MWFGTTKNGENNFSVFYFFKMLQKVDDIYIRKFAYLLMVLEKDIVRIEILQRVRALLSQMSGMQNVEATASSLKSYITTIVPTEYDKAFTLEEKTAIEDAINRAVALGQLIQTKMDELQIKRW